jgi:hypothetical protein
VRGARSLYAFHIAIALIAAGLTAAAAAVVLSASDFSVPSGGEVSRACAQWLGSGGPGAVLALLVLALAAIVVVRAVRSVLRQVRAGHRYLASVALGPTVEAAGTDCRVVETDEPLAFCAGYARPRIYLSRGLIEGLSAEELRAVVAHEGHHVRRRDPMRRVAARALADAVFFVPLLRRSGERYIALGELAADEAAVAAVGRRQPLAAALLKFSERELTPAPVAGVAPERVDHLIGDSDAVRWRLPLARAVSSVAAIVALAVVVSATTTLAPGLDWPLLLAAGCMVGMVAGPIALGATALLVSCRALRARRS